MEKSKWWIVGLAICLALVCLAPLASPAPDGLERVAIDRGFFNLGREPAFHIIADYVFPFIENEALATILAGLVGTVIIFALVYGGAWLLKSARRRLT